MSKMFALLAAFCFLVALIVSVIQGTTAVMFFVLLGLTFLALASSAPVRSRLGANW